MRKLLAALLLLFGVSVSQAEIFNYKGIIIDTDPKHTQVCFSPHDNCAVMIAEEVNKTTSTLDLALYSLTHDEITNVIIDAHKAGVKVRLLIDVAQAGGRYADDEKLEDVGIEVIRIRSSKGGLMHHKFAIMDGFVLLTGSFNWTSSGNDKNSENLLLIYDQEIIKEFQEEYDSLWEHALKKYWHKQDKYRNK